MADMSIPSEMSLAEKLAIVDKISSSVNKTAGKLVVGRPGANPEIEEHLRIKYYPSKCPAINEMSGGGWPRGRTSILTGNEDSGKTTRMLEDIAYNMKLDPSFVALWLESETSLNLPFIFNTLGVDPARFIILEHERDGAAEEAINRMETYIASGAVNMVVVNSLKCLIPKEMHTKDVSETVVAMQARLNSRMMGKFIALISEKRIAFVLISHLTTMISTMSKDPLVMSGGRAIAYASQFTLDFRKKAIQETDPIKKEEGMKIGVSVRKNHCTPGKFPYVKADYFVVYGEGTEQILSTLEAAIASGHLVQTGAWIRQYDAAGELAEWNSEKLQFNGKERFRAFCRENPDYLEKLQLMVSGKIVESMTSEEIDSVTRKEAEIAASLTPEELNEISQALKVCEDKPAASKKGRQKAS